MVSVVLLSFSNLRLSENATMLPPFHDNAEKIRESSLFLDIRPKLGVASSSGGFSSIVLAVGIKVIEKMCHLSRIFGLILSFDFSLKLFPYKIFQFLNLKYSFRVFTGPFSRTFSDL